MLRGNTHQQGSRDGDRLSGLAVSKGRHRHRRAWCLWLSRIVSSGSCSGKVEDVYVKIPHVLPMAPSPRRTNLIVSIATFRARLVRQPQTTLRSPNAEVKRANAECQVGCRGRRCHWQDLRTFNVRDGQFSAVRPRPHCVRQLQARAPSLATAKPDNRPPWRLPC